jgi:hypothetical protein
MEEINQNKLFIDTLKIISPNLNYKLIFITGSNEKGIAYKKINEKCALIKGSNVNDIVLFYQKFGFLAEDILYDNENIIKCEINCNENDINLCHMDVHIH